MSRLFKLFVIASTASILFASNAYAIDVAENDKMQTMSDRLAGNLIGMIYAFMPIFGAIIIMTVLMKVVTGSHRSAPVITENNTDSSDSEELAAIRRELGQDLNYQQLRTLENRLSNLGSNVDKVAVQATLGEIQRLQGAIQLMGIERELDPIRDDVETEVTARRQAREELDG